MMIYATSSKAEGHTTAATARSHGVSECALGFAYVNHAFFHSTHGIRRIAQHPNPCSLWGKHGTRADLESVGLSGFGSTRVWISSEDDFPSAQCSEDAEDDSMRFVVLGKVVAVYLLCSCDEALNGCLAYRCWINVSSFKT